AFEIRNRHNLGRQSCRAVRSIFLRGKTSTAAHLAMSAALDGYRVLVIDLDSQGSMTSILGGQVADEWGTVFPLLAKDYATHVSQRNRIREAEGQPPLPLDETLTEALKVSSADIIQKTHWPNIDLIGAQLNLYWAEFQIPVWRMQARDWALWDALPGFLEDDGVLDRYDIVLLDTPPALGYLTINALSAADILLVPLGASFLEFDSTGRFFDMLHATFASIEEGDNAARRAAGMPEQRFEWDAVRTVLTRYDASQQADLANVVQAYFGDMMAPHRQDFTALVGQAGERVSGIYEADPRDFNRETYLRGRDAFDRTYADFKELLVGCWWRDAQMEGVS
ncbi:MAG: AAA family ATPase, partial [Pseudomonadota bacterium]